MIKYNLTRTCFLTNRHTKYENFVYTKARFKMLYQLMWENYSNPYATQIDYFNKNFLSKAHLV